MKNHRTMERSVSATRRTRAACAVIAFAGTAVYAASFALAGDARQLAAAWVVGVAAALSWPVFGAVLLHMTSGRPSVVAWVDVSAQWRRAWRF